MELFLYDRQQLFSKCGVFNLRVLRGISLFCTIPPVYVGAWTGFDIRFQHNLVLGKASLLVSNLIHQQCVSPHTDLHPHASDVAFVNHSKPAVELPVALSVEVVSLQCANNENKPVQ